MTGEDGPATLISVATKIEPFYFSLGRRIQAARDRVGLSQQDLGSRLTPPVTRASIANIENGKQRVLSHTLVGISSALSVSVAELLPTTESPAPAVSAPSEPDIAAELRRKLGAKASKEVLRSLGTSSRRAP